MDSNLTVAEFVVVSCRTTHLPERVTLFYRISQALVVSNIVHSFVRGGGGDCPSCVQNGGPGEKDQKSEIAGKGKRGTGQRRMTVRYSFDTHNDTGLQIEYWVPISD